MSDHDVETGARCAQCDGPLPAPVEQLAVVHGPNGGTMTACSTICLAGLVHDLAGPTTPDHRAVAGKVIDRRRAAVAQGLTDLRALWQAVLPTHPGDEVLHGFLPAESRCGAADRTGGKRGEW